MSFVAAGVVTNSEITIKRDDMAQIAEWIKQAIDAREDEGKLGVLREEVRKFCREL